MAIPVIFIGIYLGIKPMLIGFIAVAVIYYLLNVHFSAKLIHYSMREQIVDLLPILAVSGSVSILIYLINSLDWAYWILFTFQMAAGLILTILFYNLIRFPEYLNMQKKLTGFIHKR